MKHYLILLVICISFTYGQTKKSIAVLELEAGGISAYKAQVLSNRLRTELFKTDKFTVLERDKMAEILIEQGFQLSGCTTNECVVEAGKLMGVEQMVAGNIAKIDNLFTIDIRLIDVETGKVLKTATEDCECALKDVLTNSIRNVARFITGLKVDNQTSNIRSYQPAFQKQLAIENHPDYKSPTTAFVLSFLLPGVGQYYNGEILKGIIQEILVYTGFRMLNDDIGWNEEYDPETGEILHGPEPNTWYYIGISISAGSWLWSWIDARASAIENNKQLEKQFGHLFELEFKNQIVGFDVGIVYQGVGGQVTIHF